MQERAAKDQVVLEAADRFCGRLDVHRSSSVLAH